MEVRSFNEDMIEKHEDSRDKVITRTSIVGIVANLFLSAFKAVIGFLSHSIAIVLDAVNNLSDAASSIITIIGAKLSKKEPDSKHPFGHGRVEYLSATVISILVLYAGITSFIESVKKILHPEEPDYSIISLVIIAVAVIVKILLGTYFIKKGKEVNSDSLVNSGKDARFDSIISASTIVGAVVFLLFGISIEAYLGVIISLYIIKSGYEMLSETISKILGEKVEKEEIRNIIEAVMSFEQVKSVHDFVMNDYGPDTFYGSCHIEVDSRMTANEIDMLLRDITYHVYKTTGCILNAIGIYSVDDTDPESVAVRSKITELAMQDPFVKEIHGYYFNKEEKTIRFDVVISFDSPDRQKAYAEVCRKAREAFPDYEMNIVLDTEFI